MKNWQIAGLVSVTVALGAFGVTYLGATEAQAQEQQVTEAQAWVVEHGQQSAGSGDSFFYVVRHNTLTGETQIIGCQERDGCRQFEVRE
jgi:hypothetical protein